MLWLGLRGRQAIARLTARCDELEQRLEESLKAFRSLDLEMTDQVDRLSGIAKRIQGRRGGRPPGKPDEQADSETQELPLGVTNGFNRHVL